MYCLIFVQIDSGTVNKSLSVEAIFREAHLQEKIVAPVNETFEMRLKHLRAGVRLNSRVALAVEWTDAGRRLKAEGYTVDISPKGCLAVIPQGFAVGQRLRLVNLTNHNQCEAVLVWRGHEGRTGWELGLELQDAPMDFWGVDL
jgi:PilZ domain